jgi:glycosyltransferase involved in cell wall biosynthesis
LPCAIDEEAFRPALGEQSDQPPVILMVGNYRNPGNREGAYAICREAVPAVAKRHPNIVFRFVGKSFPSDLQHPNVQAVGFADDLAREYARAAVVSAPITIGGGIKIKVVEALSMGRPLVATEKALEGIDATRLANVWMESIEGFAGRIIRILGDPPPTSSTNWEPVARAYGSRLALEQLTDQIDAIVRTATRKKPGEHAPSAAPGSGQ